MFLKLIKRVFGFVFIINENRKMKRAIHVMFDYLDMINAHGCCVMHNDDGCPGCNAHDAIRLAKDILK